MGRYKKIFKEETKKLTKKEFLELYKHGIGADFVNLTSEHNVVSVNDCDVRIGNEITVKIKKMEMSLKSDYSDIKETSNGKKIIIEIKFHNHENLEIQYEDSGTF